MALLVYGYAPILEIRGKYGICLENKDKAGIFMATKIRLARGGTKKRPYYRIVVTDSRSPRDGKFIEKVGTFNPLLAKDDAARLTVTKDRVEYWLGTGAQPSERIVRLFETVGISVTGQSKKALAAKRASGKVTGESKKSKQAS
jgi:small subunit ribosomal protein S16